MYISLLCVVYRFHIASHGFLWLDVEVPLDFSEVGEAAGGARRGLAHGCAHAAGELRLDFGPDFGGKRGEKRRFSMFFRGFSTFFRGVLADASRLRRPRGSTAMSLQWPEPSELCGSVKVGLFHGKGASAGSGPGGDDPK